jgi:hypothetical protein
MIFPMVLALACHAKPEAGVWNTRARGAVRTAILPACLYVCTSYRPSLDSSLLSRSGGGKTLTLDWAERAESSPESIVCDESVMGHDTTPQHSKKTPDIPIPNESSRLGLSGQSIDELS